MTPPFARGGSSTCVAGATGCRFMEDGIQASSEVLYFIRILDQHSFRRLPV